MRKKSIKLLSAFLSFVMALSAFATMPITTCAAEATQSTEKVNTYETVSSTLAPGVTQTINYAYRDDGKYVKYYVAVADLSNPNVGLHATYGGAQCTTPGVTKMTEQVAAMTELHTNPDDTANYIENYAIVAGVNGDGYNTTTGAPSGAHVMNGVSGFGIVKSANSPWFALFADGTAACGRSNTDWDAAVTTHGAVKEAIGGFQLLMKDGKVYEPGTGANQGGSTYWRPGFNYPCSFLGVTYDNKVVLLNCDGNNAGGSAGFDYDYTLEVAQELGLKDLLCLDGGGSATYLSRPEGENDVVVLSNPSDGAERAVANGLVIYTTTPPSDVFDRANLETDDTLYTPYSEIKVRASGVSPAGTPAEIPADVEWTLSDDSFGTICDGVFTSNGTLGTVELQMCYQGTIVGKVEVQIVNPTSVSFVHDTMVVPFGKSNAVDIEAFYHDVAYDVTLPITIKASDFTFSFSDEDAGKMNGFELIAPNDGSVNVVTLTADYNHSELDSFSIKVSYGKASEVVWDFENGDVSNWLGLDQALAWAEQEGLVDKSPLTSAHGNSIKEDTKDTFYMYGGNAPTTNTAYTFLATAENGQVKNGKYALGLTLDETTYNQYGNWEYNILFNVEGQTVLRDVANGLNATTLGMWVYLPEDLIGTRYTGDQAGFAMQFQLYGGSSADEVSAFGGHFILQDTGKNLYSATGDATEVGRWVYMTADISSKDYVSLTNPQNNIWREPCFIRFYFKRLEANKYTFYFDDFTLDYSSAVEDRDAPIISAPKYSVLDSLKDFSTVCSLNNVLFSATINEFAAGNASGLDYSSAKIYVDGVALDNVTASGSTITSEEVFLTSGIHEVIFEIADNMGTITRNVEILTIAGNNPIWIDGHNDSGALAEYDSIYYMDLKVADASAISTIVTEISLNHANTWELPYLTVADGFTIDYEFVELTNSVKLTITKNADCALAGEQILVSVPVRTWSWPDNTYDVSEKAGLVKDKVTAETMSKAGGRPFAPIDFEVEYGMVNYVYGNYDGYIGAFYDYFTTETKIQDETYAWHLTHTITSLTDVPATCTENGYTGRTYCTVCKSVVDWGTIEPATGHNYKITDGVLKCGCGKLFNGVYTDGKTYVDGVVVADGWDNDSYWLDGEMLTGIRIIDGYYYDFGKDGVCAGQTKFTGLFYDESVSAWRYAKLGELIGGWIKIGDYWHYFNTTTKVAVTGVKYWGPVFTFDETGMTKGAWYKTSEGVRFYYGPDYYMARNNNQATFIEIDGKTYNFDKSGYITTGIHALYDDWAYMTRGEMRVWEFDENGVLIGQITQKGVIDNKRGGLYLVEDDGFVHGGSASGHLTRYNEDYYFVLYSGKLLTNASRWIGESQTNGLLPADTYYFGEDGKLFTGIKEGSDGILYYYKDGKVAIGLYNSELVEIDGAVYLVKWSGKVAVDESRYVSNSLSNGLLPANTYYFGEDGKLFTGIKEGYDDILYYYKDGKVATGLYNSELVEINDAVYLVKWSGKVAANETRFVSNSKANGLVMAGTYSFGADGKMDVPFTGVKVGDDDILYYYKDDKLGAEIYNSELVEIDGSIYLVKWSGKVATNETRFVHASKTNGLVVAGTYTFDGNGKLVTE